MNNKRRLIKALRDAQIPPDYHWRMAAILLAVNGIDNALEFVDGLVDKGLAGVKQMEMWEGDEKKVNKNIIIRIESESSYSLA